MGGLLLELIDAAVGIGVHDAEAGGLRQGHVAHGDGAVRSHLLVIAEHGVVVHLVDVVAGEDQHVLGTITVDEGDVLADGVRRALVPLGLFAPCVGRKHLYAAVGAVQTPGLAVADVLVQLQGLVLGEDAYGGDTGIDAVGQREVNDPVFPAKGYGRLSRILRQHLQSAALAAGKQHGNAVFLFKLHFVSLSFLFLLGLRRVCLVGSRSSR